MDQNKFELAVLVRWFLRADLPKLLAIAASCELPGEQWQDGEKLNEWINSEHKRVCMVAEAADYNTIGFMVYLLHKVKIELEVLAVHSDFRRCGIGKALLGHLKPKLSLQRRRAIEVMVPERSLDAQFFFRSQLFRANQVVRGWFDETGEDGYVMHYHLTEETAGELQDQGLNLPPPAAAG